MEISPICIGLSKTTFHLIGLSYRSEIVLRKKLSRRQLLIYTATRQPMLIGMEACGGAYRCDSAGSRLELCTSS